VGRVRLFGGGVPPCPLHPKTLKEGGGWVGWGVIGLPRSEGAGRVRGCLGRCPTLPLHPKTLKEGEGGVRGLLGSVPPPRSKKERGGGWMGLFWEFTAYRLRWSMEVGGWWGLFGECPSPPPPPKIF